MANDPAIDALWFGRGGYGSNRILTRVMDALGPAAHAKAYLGYSDTGFLLGALYARRIGRAARSEEHTSELPSLMRTSYTVFCLKTQTLHNTHNQHNREKQ